MLTFPLSKSDITHCAFAGSLVFFTERIMTELLRELCRDTFTQGLNFLRQDVIISVLIFFHMLMNYIIYFRDVIQR